MCVSQCVKTVWIDPFSKNDTRIKSASGYSIKKFFYASLFWRVNYLPEKEVFCLSVLGRLQEKQRDCCSVHWRSDALHLQYTKGKKNVAVVLLKAVV